MSEGRRAAARHDPRAEARKRILKWLAIAAVVPSVLLFLGVSFFVARSEYMHAESRCPFEVAERRQLDGVTVVDEVRRCQNQVEEHRWLVVRPGADPREIGRRRLGAEYYADDRYHWSATTGPDGVVVEIRNDGTEPATFRETAPDERQAP